MSEIEWAEEDMPEITVGRPPIYQWFYDGLTERPGVWAKYPGTAGAAASWARNHDGYETRTFRKVVYMRYVGEGSDD